MITFSKIRYRNILSTGNVFTEIRLDGHKSTLIIGDNGAGKSTMLDAICFALYGRPFRKINKPQLLNSINKKSLEVELEFRTGGKNYLVRRGIKPALFEIYCDGELLNQDAAARDYQAYLEENILKLNYKSFGQVVVLGSSTFVPFMQLSAKDRREVIEDLLDIQIFTTMNTLLKEHVVKNRNEIQDIKYHIELLTSQIETAKEHNDSIRKLHEDEVTKLKEKIREQVDYVESERSLSEGVNDEIGDLLSQISDKNNVKSKLSDFVSTKQELMSRQKSLSKEISFYNEHDNCPTCKQGIDEEFKTNHVSEQEEQSQKVADGIVLITAKIDDLESRLEDISNTEDKINSKHLVMSEHLANIKLTMNTLKGIKKELESAEHEAEKIDDSKIKEISKNLDDSIATQKKSTDKRELLSIVSAMLKDGGIKTRIIKQYVPVINKLINKYLAAMEFFVQFELNETFDETIKSRFRDVFSYASFSEGEKLRIDLALMFTWRSVAKLRNSVSTNLLIMDEIMDSSLDNAGTDEFLKIINELTSDSNIFIISHKGDQLFEKFDNVIKFIKVKNFSRIVD